MIEWLSPDFLFRNAILGGLGVALLCAALGIYLVLRRLVLIGVALPQASAAGIAAVFLLSGHAHGSSASTHLLALAGSTGATFAALALLIVAQQRGRVPAEWGVGALLAIASATTILFVALNPTGDLEMSNLLRGELLAITARDLAVITVAALGIGALLLLFRRELLLASYDPEFARSIGGEPWRSDVLLYALLGGGISLGVMNAGPLVVFGFLVLPALAALRVAPGIGSAFAIALGIAAVSYLGGFAIAYRADLPTGPVAVAVAAAIWFATGVAARVGSRARAATIAVTLLALASLACSGGVFGRSPRPLEALPPGSLPALAGRPIAVLPIANETGRDLPLGSANALRDVARAAGDPFAGPGATVTDLLQQRAAAELARRGYEVMPVEQVIDAVPRAADDALEAARAAQHAGLDCYVLFGRLRRYTQTQTGMLLVHLDLALLDPRSEQILWQGSARRPVGIRAALTDREVLLDAGGPIFAEAFGNR